MQPWKTVSRRVVHHFGKFLIVEAHELELPDGRRIKDWPWLVAPDFALVLARTTDGRFICFRQNKYAIKGLTLAPVGGHIEPGEEPLAAAKRELLEETGYVAPEWHALGSYVANANRGGGQGHLFLALNARRERDPHSDDLEEQELLFLTQQELDTALARGEFKALAWAAMIALALRHLEKGEDS
jgi:ADP-ribose pyrophosphatase